MLPDRVSNPGPLTYESGALPIALRGPALVVCVASGMKQTENRESHRGVARPDILMKQAFLRYIIEYVHLQARSF